jgi:transcriptional regulator with XRE-family HTH domain
MFGARLKELREGRELSQKQLADAAGLSQRAVSHWEQNLRQPTWDAVQALCRALGVDCTAFQADDPGSEFQPAPRGRPRKPAREQTSGSKKAKGKPGGRK